MDTMSAFMMAQQHKNCERKVFDWDEAARRIVASGAQHASAGLHGDWEWTGGAILKDGAPILRDKTYVYLASTWATPELEIDDVVSPCFRMQSAVPDWDAETYWPESALKILRREKSKEGGT